MNEKIVTVAIPKPLAEATERIRVAFPWASTDSFEDFVSEAVRLRLEHLMKLPLVKVEKDGRRIMLRADVYAALEAEAKKTGKSIVDVMYEAIRKQTEKA